MKKQTSFSISFTIDMRNNSIINPKATGMDRNTAVAFANTITEWVYSTQRTSK